MHNSYNQIMYEDLQDYLSVTKKEFAKTEHRLLSLLNYSTGVRGGIILRAVSYALNHYGELHILKRGDYLMLEKIGEQVTEQILVEKRLLARKSCELVSSICLCSIALFNRNGLQLSGHDIDWGKISVPIFCLSQ